MNATAAADIASMAGGKLTSGEAGALISRVVTDSREVQSGDLFVALKGENHDGHSFIDGVSQKGVSAVLVSQKTKSSAAVVQVSETLNGLQTLAGNYRKTLRCKILGITGSNGKTSTKDFTAAILSSRFAVSRTMGNFNNHIGLPLSLLQIDDSHAFAVLEMGMNHVGEIAPLAAIAAPEIAIITNIGIAHIEHLKTQDAIALEKGALAEAVSAAGTVILNANDPFSPSIAARCRAKVLTAGIGAGDFSASDLQPEALGTHFKVTSHSKSALAFLPVPGRHMVGNAILAIAAGVTCGLSLADAVAGLEKIALTKGRLEMKEIGGVSFIDDTYNANPDSMVAALATLLEMPTPGKRIAVLGTMGELGSYSEEGHRSVGKKTAGIDLLLTVGESAEWIAEEAEKSGSLQVLRTADTAQAIAVLLSLLTPGDCVLVKGSRSARLERVIQGIGSSLAPAGTI